MSDKCFLDDVRPGSWKTAKMGKELQKFEAEYKKFAKTRGDCTSVKATQISIRIKAARSNAIEGFYAIADGVATAQSKGIFGTKIEDYFKEKEVLNAVKGVKKLQAGQLNEANDLLDLAQRAEIGMRMLEKLNKDISKDLKSRNKKSKSEPDIEKLQTKVNADIVDLGKVIKINGRIPPLYRTPGKEYKTQIDQIMKRAPKELKKEKEGTMLPRKLDMRIIKKYLNSSLVKYKNLATHCDSSIKTAGGGDKNSAVGHLDSAKKDYVTIKKTYDEFDGIRKNFKAVIEDSKDKKGINETIDKMQQINAASIKKMKQAADAVKNVP